MSGLGDALQNVGGWMMGLSKDRMLADLQKQKEERARQDALAAEERQRTRDKRKVKDTRVIQRDGKFINQYVNDEGEVLKEEPTDPYTSGKLLQDEQKGKLSLENTVLTNRKLTKDLEYYDAEQARDAAYDEARIGSANRANRGDGGGGIEASMTPEPSRGALTNMLVKEMDDLSSEYTTAPKDGGEPKLTKTEFRMVADEVIASAAKEGGDPRTQFPKALRRYIELKEKRTSVPKRK